MKLHTAVLKTTRYRTGSIHNKTGFPPGEWWIASQLQPEAFHAMPMDPVTYAEAMRSEYSEKWDDAIQKEYNSLMEQKVWEVCPLPAGRKAVGCKWVFKRKYNAEGQIARYKARLVAKGFSQKEGIDYHEVFSPVVQISSLRVLLAIAVERGWEIQQMDVDTAFLHASIQEVIYMEQPQGFQVSSENGIEMVCRLNKSLYGLKQSPRNWSCTLQNWLEQKGFSQTKSDAGIFVYSQEGMQYVLAVYVDDIIIAGPDIPWINNFKHEMQKQFKIKDLGQAEWVLGISLNYDNDGGTLKLHQSKYINDLLQRYGMGECKPSKTPIVPGSIPESSAKPNQEIATQYQSLVGSLLYAATSTRPDIAYSVSYLSRFMADPEEQHWVAAKRVLRYLKGTQQKGLQFDRSDSETKDLIGYCDADWAGDCRRRSTTGYVFLMYGAPVS